MSRIARLFLALLATGTARADGPWPAIFDPFRVETIYIQIDPAKWEAIRHDTNFYDPALNLREPCQLWMSGDSPPNSLETSITVEIRRKSDPAVPSEADPQKVSLKIDVNEYVAGQSVRGLKKLSLENGSGNGVLKEAFAMNLHRMAAESGHHAWNFGNASWVRLVVNGDYVGLYACPEQRDSTFFKNRGRYKEHASWLYEINGGISLDETVNTVNSATHEKLNYYPFRGPNPPPANFEQEVSDWVDMPSMLTMAAIEAFIANNDGLFTKSASNQGKNSFYADWLPSEGIRRTYLPWDLDGGFNNTGWDIFTGGSGGQQRHYQTLILGHPWFGEMYRHIFTELIDGPLSETALNAWLDQWEAAVGPALAEDPNAGFSEIASLRNYIAARVPNVRSQIGAIIAPPVFSPDAGEIAAGFSFSLSHPNAAGTSTIYYTTDGSDPRAYGGGVNPAAVAATGPIVLPQGTHVIARVRNVNGTTTRWSNLREATFNIAGALDALKLTEIHYKPLPAAPFEDADEFEFLEFKNTGSTPLDLSHCRLTGVEFIFPPGTVVAPGGFALLISNPAAFEARYPGVPYLGVFWKKLSDSGEKIRLLNRDGSTVISTGYSNKPPCPLGALMGRSLVNFNPSGNPAVPENWRASTQVHGSPAADDPAPPYTPGVVINEVISKPGATLEDAIELHNLTAATIDIGRWWISDNFDPAVDPVDARLKRFRIPTGTVLPPGGFVVFYESQFRPATASEDVPSPFGLSQDGETLHLASADGDGNLTGHIIGQKFGQSETDVSHGRIATSTGWDFGPLAAHSFGVSDPADKTEFRTGTGQANASPRIGPIIFSEIHYQPDGEDPEFIELMNLTPDEIALDGWRINGAAFTFPPGTLLAGGGLIVVADTLDPAGFRTARAIPAGVPVLAGSFKLSNGGEALELLKPNSDPLRSPILVERIHYNDKAPWPTEAAGRGFSLERISPNAYGNDPLNWHTATPGGSPGFFHPPATSTTIARGSGWNFHALGRDLGSAWRGSGYSDSAWADGRAPLGFGASVNTALPYTGSQKPITTWLGKSFAIANPAEIETLTASVNYNDGFIAYPNGTEIARRSLPADAGPQTPASPHPHGSFETIDLTSFKSLLGAGRNILAVELHLAATDDADAYFDADLTYTRSSGSPVVTDSDEDGIPDDWETANGLDPNDPGDATSDLDGDGFDALSEYFAGTDPNDSTSRPHISAFEQVGDIMRISFPTVIGRTYAIEWSEALTEWFVLAGELPGTGGIIEVEDPTDATRRFYRIRVRP